MNMGRERHRKIVLVGDGGTGKSSLVMVFRRQEFCELYVPTIFESYCHEIENRDL
jgi:Ras family protein A